MMVRANRRFEVVAGILVVLCVAAAIGRWNGKSADTDAIDSAAPKSTPRPRVVARRPMPLQRDETGAESRTNDSAPAALGAVELVFATASDRAVEGIEAVLGREGEPSIDAVTGRSGADGRILFELPPGRYRWWPANDAAIDLNPPNDASDLMPVVRADSIGWSGMLNAAHNGHASGAIDVTAGEIVSYRVVVHRGTSVVGRIPYVPSGNAESTPSRDNSIHLFRTIVQRHPNGPLFNLTRNEEVRSRIVDDSTGEFEFGDVAPGEYVLNAWWRRGADYFVVRRMFRVLPEQRFDLGLLEPRNSAAVEIETRVLDAERNVLTVERIFGASARPIHVRALLDSIDARTDDAKLSLMFEIDLLTRFRVFGLAEGNHTFSIVGNPESSGVFPEALRIKAPIAPRFSLPAPTAVTYDYSIETPLVDFTVEVFGDPLPARLLCCAMPEGTGSMEVASKVGIEKTRGTVSFRLRLPDGRHHILLHTQTAGILEKRYPAENVQAFATVVVSANSRSTSLTLSPGVRHFGRAVDADGRSVPSKTLVFRLKSTGDGRWPFSVTTDADGAFTLTGLPPGETLFCMTSAEEVFPNDGKGEAVELRLAKHR